MKTVLGISVPTSLPNAKIPIPDTSMISPANTLPPNPIIIPAIIPSAPVNLVTCSIRLHPANLIKNFRFQFSIFLLKPRI